MSSTIVTALVIIISNILPLFGLEIGSEKITEITQALVTIGGALIIWYQRTTLQKAPPGEGDVNALGMRR